MSKFIKLFKVCFDFIGLLTLAALVGFWWTNELTQGNRIAALSRATGLLILFLIYFYQSVFKYRTLIPKFFFAIYSVLAVFTVIGYICGFFID